MTRIQNPHPPNLFSGRVYAVCSLFPRALRGKGKGVGRVREGRGKNFWGDMVFPRPSCIAFTFVFKFKFQSEASQ
jgi:hypothetical protein